MIRILKPKLFIKIILSNPNLLILINLNLLILINLNHSVVIALIHTITHIAQIVIN